MSKLKIAYISAEMSPYAKTGGLADVAGALPKALQNRDIEIVAIMPKYKLIEADFEYVTDYPVLMNDLKRTCIVRKDKGSCLPVYFIDNYDLFDRPGIYGNFDDDYRYAFFCNAILIFLKKIGFKPDVIHLNDWHTGPIALLLKEIYNEDEFYKNTKSVLSIHNLRYQGLFGVDTLKLFGVGKSVFIPEKTEFYGSFNYLKTGISYADQISTVSQTYAEEILTPEYGERLNGHLSAKNIVGILNGIDNEDFDPADPEDMYYAYSFDNIKGKQKNRAALLKELELTNVLGPVFGIVTRLDDQKGLSVLLESFERIFQDRDDIALVLLGTGDRYFEDGFRRLHHKYPNLVSANIEFNLEKAKHIYAGSDLFLMPSKFEPCGLGQLISLRYGTLPIVRETGGLKDTVIDIDHDAENGIGFTFDQLTEENLSNTIYRAIEHYYNRKSWNKLVKRAMSVDNSWNNAAQNYIKLYKKVLKI